MVYKVQKMKKIFVADPSLDDLRGHHYGLSITIVNAAKEIGYQTAILANKRASEALLKNSRYHVFPIFSASIYFMDGLKGQKKCGDFFYAEFLSFIREKNVGSDDIVLFHTAIGEVYAGLLLLIQRLSQKEIKSLPEIHVCTPYNEDLMPGSLRKNDLCKTISMISNHCAMNEGKIYFWVENKSLVNHYAVRTNVNHIALHIPLQCRSSIEKVIHADLSKKPIVSYLGAAREEKGFLEVVKLLRAYREKIIQEKQAKKNVRFFIHCVPQKVGYTDLIKNAIAELKELRVDLDIMLWDQSLSEDEYYNKIKESAAIFLLYDKRYQVRGSGILAEALTMGCRIIATPESVCALYADPTIDCISSDINAQLQYLYDMTNPLDDKRKQRLIDRTKANRQLHDPLDYLRRVEARQCYQQTQGSFYAVMSLTGGIRQRMVSLSSIDPLDVF